MAVTFSVPKSPTRSVLEIDTFLGVDLTNTGSNISETRSPNAPNMIRDVPGKVRKRMGYQTMPISDEIGDGIVYGAHTIKSTTSTNVTRKNICSGRNLTYSNLGANESVYIYCNACCLPVGTKVHLQFRYKNSGVLKISPYYDTLSYRELTAVNAYSTFYANYNITEPTNAFIITNQNTSSVNVEISDIMLYFVEEDETYNQNYSSYAEINETKIYSLGDDHTESDISQTITGETYIDINSSQTKGLVALSFDLQFSSITVKNLEITYKGMRGGTETLLPIKNIFTSNQTTYNVFAVIDPAVNHTLYSLNTCYLSKIGVKATTASGGSYSTTVTIKNIHIREAELKEDFDTEDTIKLYHVSNNLWLDYNGQFTVLTDKMNAHRSLSWQNENKLYIIDGASYLVFDQDDLSIKDVTDLDGITGADNTENVAYVPTLTIGKSPSGGGVSYENLNLLTPAFIETFNVSSSSAETTQFQLSFGNLVPEDTKKTKVWVLSGSTWVEKQHNVDFTVNTTTGVITFTNPPGASPLTGEDNVKILAFRAVDGYADMIKNCTIGALFGVNGAADRLFLSGNPNHLNRDWHSGQYLFNYFEDTSYSRLGSDNSAIVGYSIVNNYLATHKDENDPSQSVIIREGDLVVTGESSTDTTTVYTNEPAFKIINTLQGPGAIAPYSFANLQTEPVFLTRSGIQAITAQDLTGEKYSQNRSFYIDGKLLEESDLDNAYALVYNDMYMLFINSKVYVLDGLQATRTDKSEPYASRQYAAFYLTNIPAYIAWLEDNELWFGTTDGRICKVYSDKDALESYNDDGQAISAWWETCDTDGRLFYKNKTFRYVALRLTSAIKSRVKLWSLTRGIWTLIKETKELSNRVLTFSEIQFSCFTFNNDTSDPVASSKLRIKKVDKARFKFENSNLNEPFGIQDIAFEYVENGNFKG